MDPTPPSEPGDPRTDLVRRASRGDRAAFDALAGHYRAALLALAFLRTGHLDEAEDLAQEILAKAWEKLPTLRDPAAFVPWVKAVAANACNNWYRRSGFGSDSPLEGEGESPFYDPAPQPLETVLKRERQRELHAALLQLPETNRTALMMHVWGGYSYGEIAAFTGVRVTTVEGRIYRAKRQLRRLLLDRGAEFMGDPALEKADTSRRPMSKHEGEGERTPADTKTGGAMPPGAPLALAMFTRRFSTMIDAGIGLVRCLEALHEVPPPYGEAAKRIQAKVEQGYTLSLSMREEPDLFSAPYTALVRAGEVGACLEETLQRAAQLLTQEWELARLRPGGVEPLFISLPASAPQALNWDGLTPYQRSVTVILFCEIMSLLLMSGVPILQTLELVAPVFPSREREGLSRAREAMRRGEKMAPSLEAMNVFPRFVIRMVGIGEEGGHLDRTLHAAAETLKQDLEAQVMEWTAPT
jgi:RNA polymerase sigma-70 factor (ECF subfamily)